jgi:hypothetical protein
MRDVYLTIDLTAISTGVVRSNYGETPHRCRLQFELPDEEAKAQQIDTAKLQRVPKRSLTLETSDATVESAAPHFHLLGCPISA